MMRNVLILTYWSYPDALIQTYTLPYIAILKKNIPPDSKIFLVTLEKNKSTLAAKQREQIESDLIQLGLNWVPFEYRPFGIRALVMWVMAFLKLSWLIIEKKIHVIHCWCTPAGAIGFFLSTVFNRKLVLDSYEPHAEAMVENGTWKKNGIAFRLLFWLEREQTRQAHYIISATEGMRQYAKEKYNTTIRNFAVKPACVDLQLFNSTDPVDETLRKDLGLEDKIVCVYAGKFGGIYLGDEVFDFVKVAISHWGDFFRFLILTNHSNAEILEFCNRAGIEIDRVITRFVPHKQVARYMKLADFGITPVKPVPTKRYCTPIKNGEYWALGLPVVMPANISDDATIVEANNIGAILHTLDQASYKKAILKIDELLKKPGINNTICNVAIRYRNYSIAEEVYRKVYSSI